MNVSYATLDETRAAMMAKTTAQNDVLRPYPVIASRRIDLLMGSKSRPYFAPYYEARKIRVTSEKVNSYDGTLDMGMPLLAAVSIVAGTTTLTIGTDIELFPDSSMPPFTKLRLSEACPYDWWYYGAICSGCGYAPYFVTVTGWWGYNSDYANAYLAVDTLSAAMTTTTGLTFTVSDADGENVYGYANRLSPYSIVRINDELMIVSDITPGTNIVTVAKRGDLGTTPATHVISSTVSVFQVEQAVRYVTARQAGLLFSRRGAYVTVETTPLGGELRYPTDLLSELREVTWMYANG